MVGLFASDLDGTLLGATHQVSRPVLRAIRAATDSGEALRVATGQGSLRSPDDFGFGGVPIEAVCANGAIVIGRDGSHSIPSWPRLRWFPSWRSFPGRPGVRLARPHLSPLLARRVPGPQGRWRTDAEGSLAAGAPSRGRACLWLLRRRIVLAGIVKVNCRPTDSAVARALEAYVSAHTSQAVNAPFSPQMLEITDPPPTRTGGRVARGWLGLREDQVAVYGDGGNDVAMLRRFSRSYAPAGAMPRQGTPPRVLAPMLYAVPRHVMATVRDEGHSRRARVKGTIRLVPVRMGARSISPPCVTGRSLKSSRCASRSARRW